MSEQDALFCFSLLLFLPILSDQYLTSIIFITTMSSSLNPLPIVVCALDDQIGGPVSELLLPDIEG
jgi:hypothetical protein